MRQSRRCAPLFLCSQRLMIQGLLFPSRSLALGGATRLKDNTFTQVGDCTPRRCPCIWPRRRTNVRPRSPCPSKNAHPHLVRSPCTASGPQAVMSSREWGTARPRSPPHARMPSHAHSQVSLALACPLAFVPFVQFAHTLVSAGRDDVDTNDVHAAPCSFVEIHARTSARVTRCRLRGVTNK